MGKTAAEVFNQVFAETYCEIKHKRFVHLFAKETCTVLEGAMNDCRYVVEVSYHFAVRLVQAVDMGIIYNLEGQK